MKFRSMTDTYEVWPGSTKQLVASYPLQQKPMQDIGVYGHVLSDSGMEVIVNVLSGVKCRLG